jgi:hypothetical protein
MLLTLASAVMLGSEFFCLRFETSVFVASYDSHVTVEKFNLAYVRVTLRLAVYRQSVRLGVRPLEAHDQRFFPTELLR